MPNEQQPNTDRIPVAKIGNIGKLKPLKFSAKGTAWIEFALAVNRRVGDGEQETKWYTVKAFNSRSDQFAENVASCLSVGKRVLVIGKGEVEHFTRKDGTESKSMVIFADAIGPDLRWQTAEVEKVERQAQSEPTVDEDEEPF